MNLADVQALVHEALQALAYHQEQTRPIEATQNAIQRLASALGPTPKPEPTAAPVIWLAYRVSHLYGGAFEDGQTENREQLLDADTDPIKLARRVNAHFADPKIIQYERGNKLVIPAFATKSNVVHGSGGGCSYHAHVELRKVPRLEVKWWTGFL